MENKDGALKFEATSQNVKQHFTTSAYAAFSHGNEILQYTFLQNTDKHNENDAIGCIIL